jgi:hypothetical protein
MAPKQMVLTTIFEWVTVVDHNLQRVAAIAKDIPMEVVKRKHEGASNRYVGRPRINTRVVLFVIDIKEEDVHDKSNVRKKKLKRGTYTNWFDANLWPLIYVVAT